MLIWPVLGEQFGSECFESFDNVLRCRALLGRLAGRQAWVVPCRLSSPSSCDSGHFYVPTVRVAPAIVTYVAPMILIFIFILTG